MFKNLLILAIFLACSIQVFALGGNHPADKPVNLDKAPTGLNQLINNQNRVHGFFVNAEDRFFFSGDTSAFSSFLKQYTALKNIAGHRLIVHSGKGVAKSPWDDGDGKPCDWMLDVAPVSWREGNADKVFRDKDGSRLKEGDKEYLVELHVWTKGKVDISKLKIPKGVLVVHEEAKQSKKKALNTSSKVNQMPNQEKQKQFKMKVKSILTQTQTLQMVHVHFSANSFNECWKYIDNKKRTEEDVENMLLLANASLWHWKQRKDCKPLNLSIAYWMLGRVNCLAGNLPLAKQYGNKCIDISINNGLSPFYVGYGYEVMADASALDAKTSEAEKYLKLASEQLKKVKDKFERDLLKKDLDRIRKLIHGQSEK